MSIQHIAFDDTTPHGRQLRRCLQQLEDGLTGLIDIFAIIGLMRDAGQTTSYLVSKFGFPDIATAQAAYDELNSLQSKLTTDAQVSSVNAAMLQAFRKFG